MHFLYIIDFAVSSILLFATVPIKLSYSLSNSVFIFGYAENRFVYHLILSVIFPFFRLFHNSLQILFHISSILHWFGYHFYRFKPLSLYLFLSKLNTFSLYTFIAIFSALKFSFFLSFNFLFYLHML